MMTGSTPTVVWSRIAGPRPQAVAARRPRGEASSTPAAPSEIGDELPGRDPPAVRAGTRSSAWPAPSTEVSGRMLWSLARVCAVERRAGSSRASNRPAATASAASRWERTGELVHLLAADVPAVGDQLGALALRHEVVAVAQLGRPRVAVQLGDLARESSSARGPCARRRRRSPRRGCPRRPARPPSRPRSGPTRSAGRARWPGPRAGSRPAARRCGRCCGTARRTARCSRRRDPRPPPGSSPARPSSAV